MKGQHPINIARVLDLRKQRMSYKRIGVLLAREDGRDMPYLAGSVYQALRHYAESLMPDMPGRSK